MIPNLFIGVLTFIGMLLIYDDIKSRNEGISLFFNLKKYDATPKEKVKLCEIYRKLNAICPLAKYGIEVGQSSVTVNKKTMYLCLTNPKTKEFYNDDILLYVAIHELSHIIAKSYSEKKHNDEFWTIFNDLIDKSFRLGYIRTKNPKIPKCYCNVKMY